MSTSAADGAVFRPSISSALLAGLGFALVAVVLWIGSPNLSALWIQGDEHSFIAANSDVTGLGSPEPTPVRLILIFFHRHLDLYQPIPILTYAIEAALWGGQRVFAMRLTDVLIHALNALLLWRVFWRMLPGAEQAADSSKLLLTWSLALLWAVHPTITGAFAADMGRTHLLSATFLLLSLLAHLRALDTDTTAPFAGSIVFLVLAMMCKPVAGWFLIIFAIDAGRFGFGPALRSPRVYVVGIVCLVFAALTLWATQAENMLKDSEPALFGDPLSRAAVGVAYYFSHLIWPVGLTTWYPPDVDTGWAYWAAWVGTAIFIATCLAAFVAVTSGRSPLFAIGVVWFWAAIFPLLGIVGARVAAAQDRYLYVPLMGFLLAVGALLTRIPGAHVRRGGVAYNSALLAAIAALCVAPAYQLCEDARSTLRRAQRVVARDDLDPRRHLLLAVAIEFAQRNPDPARLPDAVSDPIAFPAKLVDAARLAENQPPSRSYFKDGRDRAMFHFRVAEQLFGLGDFEGAFNQARRAADFDANSPLVLMQFAHACQALHLFAEELEAYRRLETRMPANADFRAKRLTEFGTLLLDVFEQPAAAKPRFQQALEADPGRVEARLGLARCEILAGQGAIGLAEAQKASLQSPGNPEVQEVMALYYARSQQWEDAFKMYRNLLDVDPVNYEALRGFHGVSSELNRMRDAANAWQDACRLDSDNPVYRSFFIFAAACAGIPEAGEWADQWLEQQADNRFACLARMVIAARAGEIAVAVEWARRAAVGPALPRAKELARGEAFIRTMQQRGEVGAEGNLIRAMLLKGQGLAAQALTLTEEFTKSDPNSPLVALARSIAMPAASAPKPR